MARHKYNQLPLLLLIIVNATLGNELYEILQKTDDFFENLMQEHPFLSENNVTKYEMNRIYKDIDNYQQFIARTYNIVDERSRIRKRDLSMLHLLRNSADTFVLDKIEGVATLQAKFPKDINLFTFKNEIYAVTLESKNPEREHGDYMVLYQYKDEKFETRFRESISGGTMVEVHNIDGFIYITSAQYSSAENPPPYSGSTLYNLVFRDEKPILEKAQTLNTIYMNSLIIWEFFGQTYMAVSNEKQVKDSNMSSFGSDTLIYKWAGKNFDFIQSIKTLDAQSVAPFAIGNFFYIAVANYKNERGDTDIESEIFKFDFDRSEFVTYQKFKTHAARDIKYFYLEENNGSTYIREHFLVVANNHVVNEKNEQDYMTESVIYKYSDNSFVPFQSIKLHAPIQWLPVRGTNGEFVLLVSCLYHGVKAFQYNGWRFTEVSLQTRSSSFEEGVVNMRYLNWNNRTIVAMTNSKTYGEDDNIFEIHFTKRNDVKTKLEAYEKWCNVQSDELESDKRIDDIRNMFDKQVVAYDNKLEHEDEHVVLSNATIYELVTENFTMYDRELLDLLSKLAEEINNIEVELNDDLNVLEHVLSKDANLLTTSTFKIPYLEVKCIDTSSCNFTGVEALHLNNRNLDQFLNDVVYLDSGVLSSVTFDHVVINKQMTSLFVNDHPAAALIDRNTEFTINKDLTVVGDVLFEDQVFVDDTVDGVPFALDKLLLKQGPQNFTGPLLVRSVEIDNLKLNSFLNGLNLTELFDNSQENDEVCVEFDQLNVTELTVDGLMSGFNITDVYMNALKTNGTQSITEKHTYEFMSVDEVIVDTNLIEDVDVNTLISVEKDKHYEVAGTWVMEQPMFTAEHVVVTDTLNDIPVIVDGQFNFLLYDANIVQNVTGEKIIDVMTVVSNFTSSVYSTGEVGVRMVDNDVITSPPHLNRVRVKGSLFVNDITSPDRAGSMLRIRDHGLKLEETEINSPVVFQTSVSAVNLTCEKLNNVKPSSWVLKTDGPHYVTATKTFKSNVTLHGNVDVHYFNDVDLHKLSMDVMTTVGNNDVIGRKTFRSITADSIVSPDVSLNGKNWSNVVKITENDTLPIKVVLSGKLTTNELQADELIVNGLFNGVNWDHVMDDCVTVDGDVHQVNGVKTMDKMYGGRLSVDGLVNGVDLEEWCKSTGDTSRENGMVQGNVFLDTSLTVDELVYQGAFDGVPHAKFEETYLQTEGDQNITTPIVFRNVVFENGARITSDEVNNINLTNLIENTLRIDKDEVLGDVTFVDEVVVKKMIDMNGRMNGVKFEDEVVVKNSDNLQEIFGFKLFLDNLIVNGNLQVDGDMSGVNMTRLCSNDEDKLPNMLIMGSVYLENEPRISGLINGLELQEVNNKQIWLKNKPTTLSGKFKFENMKMVDDVIVEGLVNNMDLTHLENVYLSKSIERKVTGDVEFAGGLILKKRPTITNLTVHGLVNKIKMDELVENVMLLDKNQTVKAKQKYFDVSVGDDLVVNGSVSGLNLSKDVLRYDVANVTVSGPITIRTVVVNELDIEPGGRLQNVNLDEWSRNAVRIDRDCIVKDNVYFHNVSLPSGLRVQGHMNDRHFNKSFVVTVDGNQTVTAAKIFNNKVNMKSLNVKNKLNRVEYDKFLNKLALNNQDNVFSGKKTFDNDLTVDDLNVEGSVFGVDINDLKKAVDSLEPVDNLDEKFERLSVVARDVAASLNSQAYFLDHYELIAEFKSNVTALFPYKFSTDSEEKFVIVQSNENKTLLDVYVYDDYNGKIVQDFDGQKRQTLPFSPEFSQPFVISEEQYMIYEMKNEDGVTYNSLVLFGGNLVNLKTNRTTCVTPLRLPDDDVRCFFLGQYDFTSKIMCRINKEHKELHPIQEFYGKVVEASSLVKNDVTMLVVLTRTNMKHKQDGNITVYHYDLNKDMFVVDQVIPVINPLSLSMVHYRNDCFIAVASGYIQGTVHNGLTTVYRYETVSGSFIKQQYLTERTPIKVKFAVLPTSELVLYILTENPAKPFTVYRYKGIETFVEFTTGYGLQLANNIYTHTNLQKQHFVVTYGYGKGQIFKAGFKGKPPH